MDDYGLFMDYEGVDDEGNHLVEISYLNKSVRFIVMIPPASEIKGYIREDRKEIDRFGLNLVFGGHYI